MRRNEFYHTVFQRSSFVKEAFLGFFFSICSWPRLVLEVFLRKNMGERYFSLTGVIIVFGLLLLAPNYFGRAFDEKHPVLHTLTWYVFALAFLGAGIYRYLEIRRLPSVFDFARFSLSTGEALPVLKQLVIKGRVVRNFTSREINTLIEPGIVLLLGLLLWGLQQYVGVLLVQCSIIYSLSHVAAYRQAAHFLMDHIDQTMCNDDLGANLRAGLPPSWERGVSFLDHLPTDPEQRQKIAWAFETDEPGYEVH